MNVFFFLISLYGWCLSHTQEHPTVYLLTKMLVDFINCGLKTQSYSRQATGKTLKYFFDCCTFYYTWLNVIVILKALPFHHTSFKIKSAWNLAGHTSAKGRMLLRKLPLSFGNQDLTIAYLYQLVSD